MQQNFSETKPEETKDCNPADWMKTNNLDAIASTTAGIPSLIDLVNGNYNTGFSFSSPAAKAGYPHITVPMGFVFGLPLGFSFIGTAWDEGKIIGLAYAFEQATHHRQVPQFLKDA